MNNDPAWEEKETRSLTGTDALADRFIPVPWGAYTHPRGDSSLERSDSWQADDGLINEGLLFSAYSSYTAWTSRRGGSTSTDGMEVGAWEYEEIGCAGGFKPYV